MYNRNIQKTDKWGRLMELLFVVLSALSVIGVGYLGQRTIGFDRKAISAMALYLMQPFLAFRTFYTNEITIDYLYILLFCVLLCIGMIFIVHITATIKKSPRSRQSAMVLSGVFMNSGNYGVPIILLAFGNVGVDYAVIMMVIQSFLMNTIGVYYAGKGSVREYSIKQSLLNILKMPMIYGSVLGIAIQLLSVPMPDMIMKPINLIADATIPTIMLVLGMQLGAIKKKNVSIGDVSTIMVQRMLISPVLALLLIWVLPIEGMLAQVLIVLSAMPSAANTMMLSLEFGTEPDLVSYSTLVTTLFSIVSVPLMLMLVM
jgi:malate permease and related proteins